MVWKEYMNDRMIEDRDGYYVIVPKDVPPCVSLVCPVCSSLHRNEEDELAYLELSCCHMCAQRWARPNKHRWMSGWRPDKEIVLKDVQQREKIKVTIDVDGDNT